MQYIDSLKDSWLPLVTAAFSLILFQLALHDPVNARIVASLETSSVVSAGEFNGVYVLMLAKLFYSLLGDAELSLRLLTAIFAGLSAHLLQKLLPRDDRWPSLFVLSNIAFLYFSLHSLAATAILLWFSAVLWAFMSDRADRVLIAGAIIGIGFGIDSLLALALSIYAIGVIVTDLSIRKPYLAALPLALGASAWALLAYMLYGAVGHSTALLSGLQDLFTQINPLRFGLGLVLTFNILLYWVFRSPSASTGIKYLGSLMIVLCLFVRAEPHYLVLLLILAVVYLSRTGGLPKQRWVLPVYASLNVASFFLMPSVQVREAHYNVQSPPQSEAGQFLSEYFAKHHPAYASLEEKATSLAASKNMLASSQSISAVIVDPAAETLFDLSALRSQSRDRVIGGYSPSAKRFQTVFNRDTSMMSSARGYASLLYLATSSVASRIDSTFKANKTPFVSKEGMRLFTVDSSAYGQFFDAYIYHHFRRFH